MAKLYAWAHAMTADEVTEAGGMFPGLGFVLNSRNLAVADRLIVPPLVDVRDRWTAGRVGDMARAGVRFAGALILDERNVPGEGGPSGPYMTPAEYRRAFQSITEPLAGTSVRISTMGLSPVGGPIAEMLRARRFDDAYHLALPKADLQAWNPNGVRRQEIERVLDDYPSRRWILSPAPFRGWWDRMLSPMSVRAWAEVARDPRVFAVALWCVREHRGEGGRWQIEHGLLDRYGRETNVGREVRAALHMEVVS